MEKETKIVSPFIGNIGTNTNIDTNVNTNVSAPNGKMKVYKKRSTFKGATDTDFWYSATRSDGNSVICKFKCDIPTDSMAFEISNIIGNFKKKEVVVQGESYINYTYYINSCDFSEIEGEALPI